MTDNELLTKAAQAISALLSRFPDAEQQELMQRAYLAGIADGGNIISAHVEGWAATQKAML
jgi:hypothetical protein